MLLFEHDLRCVSLTHLHMRCVVAVVAVVVIQWMVLEARRIVDEDLIIGDADTATTPLSSDINNNNDTRATIERYNRFSYDDAARHVYGMDYATWKQRHMKATTAEQLQKYQASIPLHAKHDATLLQPRTNDISTTTTTTTGNATSTNITSPTTNTLPQNHVTDPVAALETPATTNDMTVTTLDNGGDEMVNDISNDHKSVAATSDIIPAVTPSGTGEATRTAIAMLTETDPGMTATATATTHVTSTDINNNTTPKTTFHSNVCCVDLNDEDDDDIQMMANSQTAAATTTMMTRENVTSTTTTSNATNGTTIPNVEITSTELATNSSVPTTTSVAATTVTANPMGSKSQPTNPHSPVPKSIAKVQVPDMKSYRNQQFPVLAIVTISDRAYAGIYSDRSGPMIANTIRSVPNIPNDLQFIQNMIVPDDMAAIQAKIRTICDNGSDVRVDCIITTGGTGFGVRDVTPEATREVISYEMINFISYILSITGGDTTTMASASSQAAALSLSSSSPLNIYTDSKADEDIMKGDTSNPIHKASLLSRGVVGVISSSSTTSSSMLEAICDHHTLIVNLPGSPTAIQEMLPILLPYILHIIVELQHITPDILHIG